MYQSPGSRSGRDPGAENKEDIQPQWLSPRAHDGKWGLSWGKNAQRGFELVDILTEKTYKTELYVLISILFTQGAAIIQQPEAMLTTFLIGEGLESTWRL